MLQFDNIKELPYIYAEIDMALLEDVILHNFETMLPRQYREIEISKEDYDRVVETPGELCFTPTTGAGNSLWWFYHSLDGVLCFAIMSVGLTNGTWRWQRLNTLFWQDL
jgi:hypothetical protein